MASGGEKNWTRPWSMEEIIENAENWSLAGDAALLNTLKAYSEKLVKKVDSLSDNVDDLLHNLNEVSLKLDLSHNTFQSLRDTQFIESRVYEDDETLDFKEEVKEEEKQLSKEENERLMLQAVVEGMRVTEKYYDKIEVPISDSEDEESDKRYVLRPKDLYAHRPLPFIIGSEEWYKKWHVGLASSSSESESEKVSETYSDSDSGDDLPKDVMKGSETSSELDFSSRASDKPAANSTFNQSAKKADIFAESDGESAQGSVPIKTPMSSKTFAEQLAAKLGDVVSEREDTPTDINRKPIQPARNNKFGGDIFFDEPPPLDDLEDTILPKSAQKGLFSGGQGLFDDNDDDEPFWGQKDTAPSVVEVPQPAEGAQTVKEPISDSKLPKSSKVTKGLFDSGSESSDEDLFSTKPKQTVKPPFLQPFATTAPLFEDEPPELEVPKKPMEEPSKKKPVGGVSIFGKSDLFSGENVENILKSRQAPSNVTKIGDKMENRPDLEAKQSEKAIRPKQLNLFEDNSSVSKKAKNISLFDENDEEKVTNLPGTSKKTSLFDDEAEKLVKPIEKSKKTSLFDDDDDLFKDDLFSGITTKKLTSSLFDASPEKEDTVPSIINEKSVPKVDLFSDYKDDSVSRSETGRQSVEKKKKNVSLFSDDEEEEEDLFVGRSKVSSGGVKEGSEVSGDVVDEVDKSSVVVADLPQRQVIGAEKGSVEKKVAKGLFFDDSLTDDEAVDLFKESGVKNIEEDEKLMPTEQKPTTSLFEDSDELFKETSVRTTENAPNLEIEKNVSKSNQHLNTESTDASKPSTIGSESETSKIAEKTPPRSTVNLFGSTPPPDDDDWDTKSVPSSDEDPFSYRVDYNSTMAARSSLFDNEPPSLGPNESSGIVRDHYVTRTDTDESSFNPYASSSRRLSSDVFSEQQSQDSFFVTKSRTESTNVPQTLHSIPEMGRSTNLDITPSGNLEDLDHSKGDSSVFQENPSTSTAAPPIAKKPVSLFDDEFNDSADTDDFFSSISKATNLPKLSDKRLSLFDNVDDFLDENTKPNGAKRATDKDISAQKEKEAKEIKENAKQDQKVTKELQKPAKKVQNEENEDRKGLDEMKTVDSQEGRRETEQKSEDEKTSEVKAEDKQDETKQKNQTILTDEVKIGETQEETKKPQKEREATTYEVKRDVQKQAKEPQKGLEEAEGIQTGLVEAQKDTKVRSMVTDLSNETEKVKKPPTGSPGKLKHNLKINVGALLPGSAPPRLTKSHSLDLPKDRPVASLDSSTPNTGFLTPTLSNAPANVIGAKTEKTVSFDDALDNVEVLHSVTKDRAKIPIKRRPSTRRGRQRAIQDTTSDFVMASGDSDVKSVGQAVGHEIEPQFVEKVVSQRDGDESKVPSEQPVVEPDLQTLDTSNIPPPIQKTTMAPPQTSVSDEKSTIDNIFDDTKNTESEPDLFSLPSTKNIVLPGEKTKSSIFESEGSEDELFGGSRGKKTKTEKKPASVKKKSLFDDSSSDEDLFSKSASGGSKKKETVQKVVGKKPPKTSTTKRLENIQTDEDPLSSLLK